MNQQNLHHQLLKILQAHPHISQRELAEAMGASLGKANYCMRALMEKGLVKLENFQQAERKRKYAYLLTPAGIEERTRITLRLPGDEPDVPHFIVTPFARRCAPAHQCCPPKGCQHGQHRAYPALLANWQACE